MHCHHEKLVVVDDEVAFVGGVDFTALEGDRHDSPEHPPRPIGWHDLASRLEGPVVADVADHFRQRWTEVADENLPAPHVPGPAGGTRVQLLRTVPNSTYDFAPKGEFTHPRRLPAGPAVGAAAGLPGEPVPVVAGDRRGAARQAAPTRPMTASAWSCCCPASRATAPTPPAASWAGCSTPTTAHGRLLAATISAHDGESAAPVYVHAKLGIVDDEWLTVGSANLNEHSLFNDTEVNIATDDRELARTTRLRLWAEHLGREVAEVDGDPADVVDHLWRPLARGAGGAGTPGRAPDPPAGAAPRRLAAGGPAAGPAAWTPRRRLKRRSPARSRLGGMTSTADKATRLQELHAAPELLLVVNVWDAITAKVVAETPGTQALATPSHGIAASRGYPDGEKIPRDEMIAEVALIVRTAGDLPVTADLEAGYGDPGGTVARAIDVGTVGANLEDQMKPLADAVKAVEAAVAAAQKAGVDFVLNARTDAFIKTATRKTALTEAITRGRAYLDAGASNFFVPGKLDENRVSRLVEALGERKVNLIGIPGSIPLKRAQELGVSRVSYGPWSQNVALTALAKLAEDVYAGGGLPADTRKLN